MNYYSESVNALIEELASLPNIGPKSAQRLAFHLLNLPEKRVEHLAGTILNARRKICFCKECFNLADQELCQVCANEQRDHSTIMVVEEPSDLAAYEKTGQYKGVYHVLNGLICPSKGIMPDDLNIDSLVKRAADADEIILGTSTTMDGETTSMYLHRLLQEQYPNLNITRIAHGLPSGGLLDYADEMTLAHALSDRRSMK